MLPLWIRFSHRHIHIFWSEYLACGSRFMLSKFECKTISWITVPSFNRYSQQQKKKKDKKDNKKKRQKEKPQNNNVFKELIQ